jgi:HAD superfamily hydrolase (TIGR01509 family)
MLKRFAAVIFDMDGLLLDSERIAQAAFNEACRELELGDQTPLFLRCVGTNQASGKQILKAGLNGKADPLQFERVWDQQYFAATHGKPIPLKDGVVDILDHLAKLNVVTAVATSTSSARATKKLREAGILNRFSLLVGGDQVEHGKPHPEIYRRAARMLAVAPEQCLALEDSENGVRSALGAGMTVIQIPDLVDPSPQLRALGHIILNNLREICDYPF